MHDDFIGVQGFFKGKGMAEQGFYVKLPRGQQLQIGLHIAVFRPAYIAYGIIQPLFLIVIIIAARAIGSGHTQFQFLFIIIGTAKTGRHGADDDHLTLFAAEFSGQFHRVGAGGTGGNNHGIHAIAPGFFKNKLFQSRI